MGADVVIITLAAIVIFAAWIAYQSIFGHAPNHSHGEARDDE